MIERGQEGLQSHRVNVWAEIILLPVASLALVLWLNRSAPFTFTTYPWLWLIPLLLGLRYGLAAGATASFMLVGGGIVAHQFGFSAETPPVIQLVGGTFAALSAGQYSSNWRHRIDAIRARTEYAERRLESLTRAFFIARLSNERLEEALITQPVTLRSVMESLRSLSADAPAGVSAARANALLQLLAQYCRFESAALHLFTRDRLDVEPIAALGLPAALVQNDPLLQQAMEHDQTTFYTVAQQLGEHAESVDYRAVFPLIDATGKKLGMLVLRDLPLLAFTEENLTAATAILQYFSDESWAAAQTRNLRRRLPNCHVEFAHELIELQHLHKISGVRSMLISLRARKAEANASWLDVIHATRRGLDLYWRMPFGPDIPGMLILLPLAGPATVHGFLARVDQRLQEHGLEGGLEAAGFGIRQIPIDNRPPAVLLGDCGVQVER